MIQPNNVFSYCVNLDGNFVFPYFIPKGPEGVAGRGELFIAPQQKYVLIFNTYTRRPRFK